MKRILLFIDSLGAGGAQRQLVGLAILLKNKGYYVKVCTYYKFDFYKEILDINGIENEVILYSSDVKKRLWYVYNYFNKLSPDCIIAYQETPSLIACLVKLLGCKSKLIVSERNTTQSVGIREKIRFFFYRLADHIVPNSYAQERLMLELNPWMKSKLTTISNFVDIDVFKPVYKRRQGIPKFLVVGSIALSKNTKTVIEACRLLKERGERFHFVWYGWTNDPSKYMVEMKNLVFEHDLSDVFEFRNKQLEIAIAYQEAEYYCMPSFFEGTPNVLCEAIASGLPVVSSNVCDNPIYVKDNFNGFLFNPNSANELANKMIDLINLSDEDYMRFSVNSRKIAEEKLSKECFINKYIKILEK